MKKQAFRKLGKDHFIGAQRTPNTLEIGMQLCAGRPVRLQQLTEGSVKTVMRQVLSALAHCHARGVGHMDVKPENLLFDPKTNLATLIDFGEARFFNPQKPVIEKHFSAGTTAYRRQLDAGKNPIQTDIYAAGITCQNLLSVSSDASEDAQNFIAAALGEKTSISELLQHPWLQ